MKQVTTDYTGEGDPASLFLVNVRPIRVTTTLENGLVSKTETDYETFAFPEGTQSLTATRMNVTEKREFDYGNGQPGSLLRRTDYTYLHQSNSTYLNLNMVDRVATAITFDGNGNKVAETDNEYDNYTTAIQASGAVQHDSNFGTSYTTRGNITAVKHWRNTDGSFLTTRNQFDDTGNALQTTDPNGNTTKFDYTDSWANSSCAPAGQGKAYLTKITDALGHITTNSYNSCTGTLSGTTDPNSQTTSMTYDLMNRPATITLPDKGQTTNCYTDVGGSGCTQSGPPYQVVTTQLATPDPSIASTTVYDGLGRVSQTQLSDPQGTDLTDTAYDAIGRVSTVSNPHRGSALATDGTTTTQYDPLNRPTTITLQDGSVSSVSYTNNIATTTDPAHNQRKSTTDALGRLIEVDEPGLNAGNPASGSVTLSGTERSAVTTAGTSASGTATISGAERSMTVCNCQPCRRTCGGSTFFDSGTVTITVNGFPGTTTYGQNTLLSDVVSGLVSALNASSSPVTASSNGDVITIIAKATGTASDYSFAASAATTSSHFTGTGSSFSAAPSGSTLTNGQNAVSTFDSGTITVAINGTPYKATYGQADSASTVATSVKNALNASGSLVQASINPAAPTVVNFTTVATGTSADYSLAVSSASNNSSLFNPPSFSISDSGSALTGGGNPILTIGSPAITLYTYDALANLLTVTQKGGTTDSTKWRVRSFTYDSLSNLLTATNPESGLITYTYDDNGNLHTKKDARAITTTYAYDPLNRLTGKTYSNGDPAVTYFYDQTACLGAPSCFNIGRRTSMTDAAGSEAWAYDPMGRTVADQRTISGVTKTTSYTYNLAGAISSLTYPSSRIVKYAYSSAGRSLSAIDSANSINFATAALYSPAGALSSLQNGSSLISTLYQDKRLQSCRISVKNTGGAPTSCADASNVGNVLDYTFNLSLGSNDNGNVLGIANNRDTTRSQSFAYDAINRIASAQTQSTTGNNCWGLTFGYDAWGNLLSSSSSAPGCSQPLPLNVSATVANQISGFCYDAAGNLLDQGACPSSGSHAYAFNAENQLTAAAGTSYLYDGDGNRVSKSFGKLYWYGMGGDPLDETDASGSTTNSAFHEYIFFNGSRIASRDSSNNVNYYFSDHLGTARIITNSTGSILDDSDFYPFGGERPISSSSGNTYKFTGKERDSESGLDNFAARFNSSTLGRFLSPDPDNAGALLGSPQSWNAYSYVLNSPLNYVDPTGLDCIYINNDTGEQIGFDRGDCDNSTEERANSGYYVDGTVYRSSIWTGDNWFSYTYKPGDSPTRNVQSQCWGDCPNGASLVTAPIVPTMPAPVPSFWERGNPTADRIENWYNRHLLQGINVMSAFTGLDPKYGYCGPDAEHGPEGSDDTKEQTQADKDANNIKEVKDSQPKRPGPAPTRNPNGGSNAEKANAFAAIPALVNNGLRCIAQQRQQ